MIRRIEIEGFRSLKHVAVDLAPVTVLIGKSGTGKTNFVEAIRFLRDYLLQGVNALGGRDLTRLLFAPTRTGLRYRLQFELGALAETYSYTLGFTSSRGMEKAEEELRLGSTTLFRLANGEDERREDLRALPKPDPHRSALAQFASAAEEIALAHTALTTGVGCYDFPPDVLASDARHQDRDVKGLDDHARSYLAVYATIAADLQTLAAKRCILSALKKLNRTIDSLEPDPMPTPTRLRLSHRVGDSRFVLDLGQESYGLRRFLAHLLAIYQIPSKQCLLFEEPENGIYPNALIVLAEELRQAPGNGRGQVILTTHSPRLLDEFQDDEIRVVEIAEFETSIGPISSGQRAALREKSLLPGELLTVDEARIEPATR